MKKYFLVFATIFLVISSFRLIDEKLFSIPSKFPTPIYNFSKNPLSANKILLGRALFYEPYLSKNNLISCASCHSQFAAFSHSDHALSHGINDKMGFRNSPALINLAWQKLFMSDGAINHLDMQSLSPITNPIEMDETMANVVAKLQATPLYPRLFYQAFGDSIITGQNTLKALSQFMLTLVSANSKYDSVMRQQSVFTPKEKNGYRLFKLYCAKCHTEPLFTNYQFSNNGLPVDTSIKDLGRYRITHHPTDSFKFKVPTLRNIEFSYPYMHDGRFKKLSQVLNHYDRGIVASTTLAKELQKPIKLTANEKVDVTAFLLTLSDRSFIFNPNYFFPKQLYFEGIKK